MLNPVGLATGVSTSSFLSRETEQPMAAMTTAAVRFSFLFFLGVFVKEEFR
jgi:hypothetical protein